MHRHGRNVAHGLHVPDVSEQFFLREHVVRIHGKEGQQVEFLGRELLLLPVDPHAAGCPVDLQAADLDHFILLRLAADQSVVARQMRLHPRHKLARAEGLRHIVVRSEAEAADLVNIVALGRNHKDWRILHVSDPLADLKTVHAGQHQIQNIEVEILVQGLLQAFRSVARNLHFKTAELEVILL